MKSWRLWLLCFALWDACPAVTARLHVYRTRKGEDLTVRCSAKNVNTTRRIFCKNDCGEEDILVQTSGSEQTNGRYRIKHEMIGSPPVDNMLVTITNLRLNDSGRYKCFWDRPEQKENRAFRVEAIDDADKEKHVISVTAGDDLTEAFLFLKPGKKKLFCRNVCSEEGILVATTGEEAQSGRYKIHDLKYGNVTYVIVTITNVNMADSGAYFCVLDNQHHTVWISVAPAPTSGVRQVGPQEPTGRPGESSNTQILTMILIVVPVCVVLSITAAFLTIYCMSRMRTDRGTGDGEGGRGQNPQSNCVNAPPNAPPEVVYEELCLEDIDPTYEQIEQE